MDHTQMERGLEGEKIRDDMETETIIDTVNTEPEEKTETPVIVTVTEKCLNCDKEATMQEEEDKVNIFCGKECQEVYRLPQQACLLIDTRHTVHTMDSHLKITPLFMFCMVSGMDEDEGDDKKFEMDPTWTRIIRVESGKIVVKVYDRNKTLTSTYYLKAGNTDQIIIPRTVSYTLNTFEKGDIAKVSIILNKQ